MKRKDDMSFVMRKPVLRVSDMVRHKLEKGADQEHGNHTADLRLTIQLIFRKLGRGWRLKIDIRLPVIYN